jgi:hypothetical protein
MAWKCGVGRKKGEGRNKDLDKRQEAADQKKTKQKLFLLFLHPLCSTSKTYLSAPGILFQIRKGLGVGRHGEWQGDVTRKRSVGGLVGVIAGRSGSRGGKGKEGGGGRRGVARRSSKEASGSSKSGGPC